MTLVLRANTSFYSFPFTVTVNTTDITAVAGEDYVPGGYTVSFQPGHDELTLVVPTIDDDTVEIDEFYRVSIVSTSESRVVIGSSDVANVTIQDNEESEYTHALFAWHSSASSCVCVLKVQDATIGALFKKLCNATQCYSMLLNATQCFSMLLKESMIHDSWLQQRACTITAKTGLVYH